MKTIRQIAHEIEISKAAALCCVLIISFLFYGCTESKDGQNERLKIITIQSEALGKNMISQVYLPENYDSTAKYPVLYFLPSNGGSSYTVINQFNITEAADDLTQSNQIHPMIIVALGIDNSFGLNSNSETQEIAKALSAENYDVKIHEGMYEDYIVYEAIPYIDEHFNTEASRDGRYIGGYSMGGFAALYVAFHHPDLFSKVGGHSPSLFVDISEYDENSWQKWLYPNEAVRAERDPILLADTKNLDGLSVFLDTGETDPNVEGCQELYERLTENDVYAEYHLFSGTHGFEYCKNYMKDYLLFYSSK